MSRDRRLVAPRNMNAPPSGLMIENSAGNASRKKLIARYFLEEKKRQVARHQRRAHNRVLAETPAADPQRTRTESLFAARTRRNFLLEGVAVVKPPATAVVAYEALFIFVPPSSHRVGWPGSLESASTMRSSPPSTRAGMRCRTPDAVCAQAGKTNRFRTRRPIYQDGHA